MTPERLEEIRLKRGAWLTATEADELIDEVDRLRVALEAIASHKIRIGSVGYDEEPIYGPTPDAVTARKALNNAKA